jgi:hypothetical protein
MCARRLTVLLLALAASCGGRAGNGANMDGGSSGAASSSGADGGSGLDGTASGDGTSSSGGGSSGSGSSGTGSSSGDSSAGSSGGADSGDVCKPLPGCTSSTSCPATDGCNTCTCEDGVWECTGYACPDGGNMDCPPYLATQDEPCSRVGQECVYQVAPMHACALVTCDCEIGNLWICDQSECMDSGLPLPDGGVDGFSCPSGVPASASSCAVTGAVCGYGHCGGPDGPFAVNCVCTSVGWQCGDFQGSGCSADASIP